MSVKQRAPGPSGPLPGDRGRADSAADTGREDDDWTVRTNPSPLIWNEPPSRENTDAPRKAVAQNHRTFGAGGAGATDEELEDRVEFPHGGPPAGAIGIGGEGTIVVGIDVRVVQQKLSNHLNAFAALSVEAGDSPLRGTRMGRHLADHAR